MVISIFIQWQPPSFLFVPATGKEREKKKERKKEEKIELSIWMYVYI